MHVVLNGDRVRPPLPLRRLTPRLDHRQIHTAGRRGRPAVYCGRWRTRRGRDRAGARDGLVVVHRDGDDPDPVRRVHRPDRPELPAPGPAGLPRARVVVEAPHRAGAGGGGPAAAGHGRAVPLARRPLRPGRPARPRPRRPGRDDSARRPSARPVGIRAAATGDLAVHGTHPAGRHATGHRVARPARPRPRAAAAAAGDGQPARVLRLGPPDAAPLPVGRHVVLRRAAGDPRPTPTTPSPTPTTPSPPRRPRRPPRPARRRPRPHHRPPTRRSSSVPTTSATTPRRWFSATTSSTATTWPRCCSARSPPWTDARCSVTTSATRSGLRHLPLQLRGGRLQVVDLPDAVERAGVAAGPERVVLGVDRDVCAG
jgi:hypothetical protein